MNEWIEAIDPKLLEFWKSVGTLIVALIAAIIASFIQYQQWKTANKSSKISHNKLKLDLFMLRNEVYLAGGTLIDETLNGNFTAEIRNEFWRTIGQSTWLFGTDNIQRYYSDELFPQVKKFAETRGRQEHHPERERIIEEAAADLIKWARDNGKKHREMFIPFMLLSHEVG